MSTGGEKRNAPPKGAPWVWLTLEMMKSDAWRSANMNTRRLVDFLLVELMQHGGTNNGKLKAPHRQLVQVGCSPGLITKAIDDAERLGLIDCARGGRRVAITYSLTWLPSHDGEPATDRWRYYRNDKLKPWPERKPTNGKDAVPNGRQFENLPTDHEAGLPKDV
ncbi:MAG: hypothetical protein RIM84_20950 [Alphaproteobacteria bacterium]